MVNKYPKAKDLRHALRMRVGRFAFLTGKSPSEIGKNALNDSSAVQRILKEDSDFRVGTYEALMKWIDEHWPQPRKRGRTASAPAE
jgi:hypothetical protein